jgi:hypothetical protein
MFETSLLLNHTKIMGKRIILSDFTKLWYFLILANAFWGWYAALLSGCIPEKRVGIQVSQV